MVPWQRQPFWNFLTLDTHRSMPVIISVKFHHKRSNDLQNRKFKFCYLQIHVVSMVSTTILEVVYVAKALTHDGYHLCEFWLRKVKPFQRKLKLKNFVYFCRSHGNGSHIETCRHFMHQFKLPWSSLWSFIMIGPTISEELFGQNYWKKNNNN